MSGKQDKHSLNGQDKATAEGQDEAVKAVNKKKATNKGSQTSQSRVVPINFLQSIHKDLFGLMVETDKTMRAFGVTSIHMISNVMQAKSNNEALGYIIAALSSLRENEV